VKSPESRSNTKRTSSCDGSLDQLLCRRLQQILSIVENRCLSGSIVNEAKFKALIRKELQKREQQGVAEAELDEVSRGEWLKQQAKYHVTLSKHLVKSFDKDVLAVFFESLDKQLNALLESKEDVAEGMTVSISKGHQGVRIRYQCRHRMVKRISYYH